MDAQVANVLLRQQRHRARGQPVADLAAYASDRPARPPTATFDSDGR